MINSAKSINDERLIEKQEETIKSLKEIIIQLKSEISELKKLISSQKSTEQTNKSLSELIHEMREENNKLIKKKDDEQRTLKNRLDEIELDKKMIDLKNIRNNTIYSQKMSVIHEIEMENKIYKEEVNDLKKKNEELKLITKTKIESLDILNQLKFSQFKKKMINNLKEAKNNVSKLNLEYMDLNGKITLLQNHQLLSEVEYQKHQYEVLEKENKALKEKIIDLEKEILIQKKVSIKLAVKAKNFNNINDINDNKNINDKKNKLNIDINNINNISRNIFSNNIIREYSNKNNNIKTSTYTLFRNNNLNNNINSKFSENPLHLSSGMNLKNSKYYKYNRIIKKKNEEIEKLKILNNNIKNKFENYMTTNKSLFIFLEQCLNNFYQEFNENEFTKNINITFENIKNFTFDNLSNQEKYGILCILIKCLFPFVVKSFEINNMKEKLFKTNININLVKKELQYNTPEKYAKEVLVKKSFAGRNILSNLFFEQNLNGNMISYKNKKKKDSPNDSRIKNNKFKSLIN